MRWKRYLPLATVLVAVPLALLLFSRAFGPRVDRESLRLLEQSVRRAAVECYALEGAYPQDGAYLEEHYGVAVDHDRFLVDYIYIGSNLMPDITVLPRS